MIILVLRTDRPEAEVGVYEDGRKLNYQSWQAHRELAETIHKRIDKTLNKSSKSLNDLDGLVVYRGPGSFTGLRIGLSVANALTYALQIPAVATGGDDWIRSGIEKLQAGLGDKLALPEYGAPAHITQPRK